MKKLKTISPEEVRSRHWQFLLYSEENSDHENTLNLIQTVNAPDSLERTKGEYIYITHDPEEEGKKRHVHLFLTYKNPVYWSSVLDRFEVSAQWCQKLEYRWDTALLYLTHTNQPGKVQYSVDLLRGSDRLIQEACQAVRRYNYGHEFIADKLPG